MENLAILCVDDDELVLDTLVEQLQQGLSEDYEIVFATSGKEALELIEDLQANSVAIPLIISDQNMLGMSGDRFLIQAHVYLPETLKILLTGEYRLEAVRDALNQANLYRYLTKPWEQTDLLLTVKEALRSYKQQQRLKSQQQHLECINQQLAESLSTLEATLDATAEGVLVLDCAGGIVHFNHRLPQLLGLLPETADDAIQESLLSSIQHLLQQDAGLWQTLNQPLVVSLCKEVELSTSTGLKQFECFGHPQQMEGCVTGQVWSFRDVTDRKRAEALIQYQAQHDSLTGLANRAQFDHYLSERLKQAKRRQEHLAIIFIDLDRFKLVNDTLGHQVGDALLCQVVERLEQYSRHQDLIARWGGDEFTLILPNLTKDADAIAVAERILQALQEEFEIEQHRLHSTASIGIAVYPEDGETAELLLKHADAALYEAKAKGRNCCSRFTTALSQANHQTFVLKSALRRALEQQELVMYYQAQLDTNTQEVSHVEALSRWYNAEQGWISPSDFIPIAEKNGLIVDLGEWALWEACSQAQAWESYQPITVSVNLSPRQLLHPQFVTLVSTVLMETGLPASQLELEITESVALSNLELSCARLRELREMGINIALDDFGTGYASLSYLQQLPLDTLKIDRSFVQDLLNDSQDQAIVQAIITLAQGLGIRVVAEGVETSAIAQKLQAMGCCYLQGYWLSRPLPAAEVQSLFQRCLQPT